MLQQYIKELLERFRRSAAPYVARARARLEPLLAQARARYERLEPREQLLVQIAAGFVGLIVLYNLFYLPVMNLRSGIDERVDSRRRDLVEVGRLTATYEQLKDDLAAAQRRTVPRTKEFSLFSVVESTLTRNLERDRIASITPGADKKIAGGLTQMSVELKLTNVSLKQLVEVLYGIKTLSTPVAVSTIHIARRSQDSHSFDVEMTCIALARSG